MLPADILSSGVPEHRPKTTPALLWIRILRKRYKKSPQNISVGFFVGVLRLERRTLCSQSRCASQLRHTPKCLRERPWNLFKADAKVWLFFYLANFFSRFHPDRCWNECRSGLKWGRLFKERKRLNNDCYTALYHFAVKGGFEPPEPFTSSAV